MADEDTEETGGHADEPQPWAKTSSGDTEHPGSDDEDDDPD